VSFGQILNAFGEGHKSAFLISTLDVGGRGGMLGKVEKNIMMVKKNRFFVIIVYGTIKRKI
jgi:hypothetical protein